MNEPAPSALDQPHCEGPAAFTLDDVIRELQAKEHVTAQALERAGRAAETSGIRLDRVLLQLGIVAEDTLTEVWAQVSGLPMAAGEDVPAEPILDGILTEGFLRYARCLPLVADDNRLKLAIEDPLDRFTANAVALKTQREVSLALIRPSDLDAAFKRLFDQPQVSPDILPLSDDALGSDIERLRDLASDAPVIRMVSDMLDRAIEMKASDIHLTATRDGSRLRYRVDGVLQERPAPPASLHAALVSRLKIMASLDIAERRLPQDGRIRIAWRGRDIDLRIATMPHAHGEGVVLRILDRSAIALDFDALGLSGSTVEALHSALAYPHGMILVTGPTGSGKTTTLYAALRTLDRTRLNIITVEDPIEHHLDGINQIQVARKIGLDFAQALRSILRQDPDVILIGEIRDRETAAIAVQAALTGHLVLATLHTNTAAAAIPRLIDMGVEPYLVASTVRGIMAQRLVRRLCLACVSSDGTVGCAQCSNSGYMGRLAISEFMTMTDGIRGALRLDAGEASILAAAQTDGFVVLKKDGLDRMQQGLTTHQEVLRVCEAV